MAKNTGVGFVLCKLGGRGAPLNIADAVLLPVKVVASEHVVDKVGGGEATGVDLGFRDGSGRDTCGCQQAKEERLRGQHRDVLNVAKYGG